MNEETGSETGSVIEQKHDIVVDSNRLGKCTVSTKRRSQRIFSMIFVRTGLMKSLDGAVSVLSRRGRLKTRL